MTSTNSFTPLLKSLKQWVLAAKKKKKKPSNDKYPCVDKCFFKISLKLFLDKTKKSCKYDILAVVF